MWHQILSIAIVLFGVATFSRAQYYGKLIGEFTRRGDTDNEHHRVAGTVYAVDDNTLQIIGFSYDGQAPDAFFWIGTSSSPDASGIIIPKALGQGGEKLEAYNNDNLVIHLNALAGPERIQSYTWISVWCRTAGANFADVYIPTNYAPPGEVSLGRLGFNPRVHDVSATDVIIVNSKQIRFEGLTYDGRGPDAYFWLDTRANPTSSGIRVPQVGESVASKLSTQLNGVTRTVQLPDDYTVFNIANIGLWCVRARQDFGHIDMPSNLQSEQTVVPYVVVQEEAYNNCKQLSDDEFQVSWTVEGDDITIRLSSRQQSGDYMSFGLSGSDTSTNMIRSDVAVAWIDLTTQQPKVHDYYLSSRQQCVRTTGEGVCPDTILGSTGRSNDVTLIGSYSLDGITHITYRRPLAATDSGDKAISTSSPQYISWALGPINTDGLATFHTARTQGNVRIDFGSNSSSCPAFTGATGGDGGDAFIVPPIEALTPTNFQCDIGEAGGPKGYQGITGSVGWGIAWYINGDLIPEITVRRNVTYTFKVNGGNNPDQSASYHPFYITNSAQGGYVQLSANERRGHEIYAGPVNGSYCYYDETVRTPSDLSTVRSYREYRDTLEYTCTDATVVQPGTLEWTPDSTTPDLVYYQCYTHRFLGWKIKVTDDANVCVLSSVVMVTSLLFAILIK